MRLSRHTPIGLALTSSAFGWLAVIMSLSPYSGWFWGLLALISSNALYWAWRYHQLQQAYHLATAVKSTPPTETSSATTQITTSLKELQQTIALISQGDLNSQINLHHQSPATVALATDMQYMLQNLQALFKEVHSAGILVLTSLTEMNANAWELETAAREQTKASQQMSQHTAQIKQTTQNLSQAVSHINTLINHLVPQAINGQAHLQHMHHTMNHINQAATHALDKLFQIHQQSQHIDHVISTMTKIASQTNLLSLNAAMEAEKAKEYGRGFTIVASEIRRLANQTAIATLDIEKMVKTMQKSVGEGVTEMKTFTQDIQETATEVHQTSQQLTSLIDQIRALTPQFLALDKGMSSQTTATSHINTAIHQLNNTTTQMSVALKKSSKTLEQLKYAAQGLQKGVSQFKVKRG